MEGMMVEEQRPHTQATASSKRLVCSTMVKIGNTTHEALDSGSSISSISTSFTTSLYLPIVPVSPIGVLFGDNQQN
jgi:hypothetical protein